jgi:hypothetical protein
MMMNLNFMKKEYTDAELIERRLAGVLPLIDMDGRDFIVDWRLRELRAVNDPADRITLKGLPYDPKEFHYICFYNTQIRQTVIPDIHMIELPKDVVVLFIPDEITLDPVAVAREMGEADTYLLSRYPIQRGLKVKVTPIEQTEMVQLVQRNRDKQRLMNTARPAPKKHKGKGLGR